MNNKEIPRKYYASCKKYYNHLLQCNFKKCKLNCCNGHYRQEVKKPYYVDCLSCKDLYKNKQLIKHKRLLKKNNIKICNFCDRFILSDKKSCYCYKAKRKNLFSLKNKIK